MDAGDRFPTWGSNGQITKKKKKKNTPESTLFFQHTFLRYANFFLLPPGPGTLKNFKCLCLELLTA